MRIWKWLVLLAVLVLPLEARADGFLTNLFQSVTPGTSINNIGTAIAFQKLTWNVSGTVSACTVALDTSVDGVTWSAGGAIAGQTCTSNGTSTVASVVANYVRINMTAFTGTGSVSVTWNGFVTNPGGGGGSTGAPSLVTANLIGDYRFTEGSGTTDVDVSGKSGPLTLVNAPAWVPAGNGPTGGVTCTSGSSQSITVPTSITTTAVTIEMYVNVQYSNIGAGQDKALIINNGGGGTSNTSGIFLDTGSAFLGANIGAPDVGSFKNGAFGQAYYNAFNGTGLVSWVKGASSDTIYVNNQVGLVFQNSGTLGVDTGNNFQICGAAAGSGFASATYTTMTVYWVRFFSSALTAQQVAADYVGMSSIEAGNTFPVATAATDQVAYDFNVGDSLTGGNGMIPFISLEILNNSMSIAARAESGQKASVMLPALPTILPYFYRPSAPIALANFWMCTNDNGSESAQACLGYNRQFCAQAHALGYACSLMTMIARSSSAYVYAQTINPLIRNLGPSACTGTACADLIIDVAADPNFAPGNPATNSCYQVDDIHYTTACSYNNITPIIQAAKNSLYGNWNFGTAATYSSAGGAAISTTAGSESGNTMTFTSAGWTASTFVKGTRMVCAGITPAGYNGVWQILSNGGTTLTAYNGTTGLGVITVQGTCQGEQLQQADNYAILNFGVGNFLLSSCLDWVGRSVTIWDENGVASTLVPFNSETFNGSTTIAAGAVAIISSVLTSNSTGGCSWVRIQ